MIFFLLLSCKHSESSLQQLMSKTDERVLYSGLLSENEDIRITAYSTIFEWGTEDEKTSFISLGLQDSSFNIRWIVERNLDIDDSQYITSLPIRDSEKCLMALWQPKWNNIFAKDALLESSHVICRVWQFENHSTLDEAHYLSGILPSTNYPYRGMILTERKVEDSFFQMAVENAIDTSYPLIISTWITLFDGGLDFLKKDVLNGGKNEFLEEVDLESLCSELSSSYIFLQQRDTTISLSTKQKLQRIRQGMSLLERENIFCTLQALAMEGKIKRLLSKFDSATNVRDLLFILPSFEIFLTTQPKESSERFHSEITERVLPLLQDSESMIRMWSVRILSRTNRRNIRYLQQLEEERLDIKIEIIRAIRMLNVSG